MSKIWFLLLKNSNKSWYLQNNTVNSIGKLGLWLNGSPEWGQLRGQKAYDAWKGVSSHDQDTLHVGAAQDRYMRGWEWPFISGPWTFLDILLQQEVLGGGDDGLRGPHKGRAVERTVGQTSLFSHLCITCHQINF
jgi:hypothetical protein